MKDIIVDHCSLQWAGDENFGSRADGEVRSVTLQHSLLAESLYGMLHTGATNYNVSVIRNYFASNNDRNTHYHTYGETVYPRFMQEAINNVFSAFVFGTMGSFGTTSAAYKNMYQQSPFVETSNNWCVQLTSSQSVADWSETHLYAEDNAWSEGMVQHGGNSWQYLKSSPLGSSGYAETSAVDATAVPNLILAHVGASRPNRDSVDQRLVDEYWANNGKLAYFGTQPSIASASGLPDNDGDGIPDQYEVKIEESKLKKKIKKKREIFVMFD